MLIRGGTKALQFGDLCDEFFGRLFKMGFDIGVKELVGGTQLRAVNVSRNDGEEAGEKKNSE